MALSTGAGTGSTSAPAIPPADAWPHWNRATAGIRPNVLLAVGMVALSNAQSLASGSATNGLISSLRNLREQLQSCPSSAQPSMRRPLVLPVHTVRFQGIRNQLVFGLNRRKISLHEL
jgi:hypothetical protein